MIRFLDNNMGRALKASTGIITQMSSDGNLPSGKLPSEHVDTLSNELQKVFKIDEAQSILVIEQATKLAGQNKKNNTTNW